MPHQAAHPKPNPLMSGAQLCALMEEHDLRQVDVAWMLSRHKRQVRAWCQGEAPVPTYAALLLLAYDQGLISASWLAAILGAPTHLPPDAQ